LPHASVWSRSTGPYVLVGHGSIRTRYFFPVAIRSADLAFHWAGRRSLHHDFWNVHRRNRRILRRKTRSIRYAVCRDSDVDSGTVSDSYAAQYNSEPPAGFLRPHSGAIRSNLFLAKQQRFLCCSSGDKRTIASILLLS